MQVIRRAKTWRIVAIVAIVIFAASAILSHASRIDRRHVVVDVYNVDNYAQVFVNCVQYKQMLQDGDTATLDLGWLAPQDLITFQARNRDDGYAWGFKLRIDGRQVAKDENGVAGPDGIGADNGRVAYEHGLTHRRTYNAEGDLIGDFGCQGSGRLLAQPTVASQDGSTWTPPDAAYVIAALLLKRLSVVLIALGLLAVLWLVAAIHTSAPNAALALVPIVAFVAQGGDAFVLKCYGVAAVLLLIFPVGEDGIISRMRLRLSRPKPPDPPSAPTPHQDADEAAPSREEQATLAPTPGSTTRSGATAGSPSLPSE